MAKESKYAVRVGRTELDIPSDGKTITLVSPAAGPNTYLATGKAILESGLALPAEENAALVHAAYLGPENFRATQSVQEARETIDNNWLWTFKTMLWTPEGVYSVKDDKAQGRGMPLDVADLEKRLRNGGELSWGGIRLSEDKSVGFAPKGSYELGPHAQADKLASQGDVIIQYGVKGAEMLAEVVRNNGKGFRTWGLDIEEGGSTEKRVASLNSNIGRLNVIGYYWDDNYYGGIGFAFGVNETAEGGSQK